MEWPLISSFNLPSSHFNKLYKKSKISGNALGIVLAYDGGSFGGGGSGGSGGGGTRTGSLDKDVDHGTAKSGGGDSAKSGGGGTQGGGSDSGGYYGALGGFMGKLIGTQSQNVVGR